MAEDLGVDFFGVPLDLGKDGVTQAHEIGQLSDYEKTLVDTALEQLKKDVAKGLEFK